MDVDGVTSTSTTTMSEGFDNDGGDDAGDAPGPWPSIGSSFAVLAAVAISYKYLDSNRGADWRIHAAYCAVAVAAVAALPDGVSTCVFTELTATLVGAVYPIYRSTKAVCTPDEDDDKEWLQYWIVGGVLFVLTAWVSDEDAAGTAWLGLLIFAFFWLYFPLTCGSLLVYDHVTEPYLGPRLRPVQRKMNNAIVYVSQTLANAVHLYLVWIIFMFLPVSWKRLVAVAVGTAYPFVCSVTAAATDEVDDDTYWLTYWSVYGCLFLMMNIVQQWLGKVPGFYTLVIFTNVYLMLPMFRGAEKAFRKILVPLAGLQELLILRDSIQIKKQLLRDLDAERAEVVRRSIASFFDGRDGNADPRALQDECMQSWSAITALKQKLPFNAASEAIKKKIPFGTTSKAKDDAAPSEKTNLV